MNLKKFLPLLPALLLVGCATSHTFTRMTPSQEPRNADNQYPVEVAFTSEQQSLRWDSVHAYVLANGQSYPMRKVPIVNNRWEGYLPVPASQNSINYRFKFEYLYNSFGKEPQHDSTLSPIYTLKVIGQ
jgi:hypothetical protein